MPRKASPKKEATKLTSTVGYEVCVLCKNQFSHKEFDSLESAERYAKKTSKEFSSSSVHKCEYRIEGNRKLETSSELVSMYIEGKKCE